MKEPGYNIARMFPTRRPMNALISMSKMKAKKRLKNRKANKVARRQRSINRS